MTSVKGSSALDPGAMVSPGGAAPRGRRRSRQRWFARALVAYGSVGLLLTGASLFLVIRALPVLGSIERQRVTVTPVGHR